MGYGIKFRVWGDYACFTRPELKVERVSYDVITPSAARGIIECIYWKPSIRWIIDKITVMSPIKFDNIKLNEVKEKFKPPKEDLSKMANDDYFLYTTIEDDNRVQRGMMYLKNPDYIIEAHFEPTGFGEDTNDFKKHYNVALRRLREGQVFRQPCLGLRNFTASIKLVEDNEVYKSPLKGEIDLGFMLYDMEFKRRKDGKTLKQKYPKQEQLSLYDDINAIKGNRTNGNSQTDDEKWAEIKSKTSNYADPVFYRPIMKDGVINVAECFKKSGIGEVTYDYKRFS